MDPLHQADLANRIELLERYLRLLRKTRSELLEALKEISEATRDVVCNLEESRQVLKRQLGGGDADRSREA
jgi:hypothetical protein